LSAQARQALDDAAKAQAQAKATQAAAVTSSAGDGSSAAAGDGETERLGSKEQLNRLILERTFHLKFHHVGRADGPAASPAVGSAQPAQPAATQPTARAGFGLEYDRVAVHAEAETLQVAAQGQVTTTDGRSIDFSYALLQSRQSVQREEVHVRLGDAKQVDPLALDLDGNGVQLGAGKMGFDLNNDGTAEQVSQLGSGDAWLALDRNGNGRIDNGSELFGPSTGSGFGELRALDGDGNGFIDEGDAAFGQLKLWRPSADGGGALTSLSDAGVGAISVASVASEFALQGGATRETGVYLRESGVAGAVQHVDLDV
jgi:hypothetical protein